jgi:hypothetical protein
MSAWAIGAYGFLGLLGVFAACVLFGVWATIRQMGLSPPIVTGRSSAEVPRYLELATASTRQRLEGLGFHVTGCMVTQPIQVDLSREVASLVMRNDQSRAVAYLRVRSPFSDSRPVRVAFDSFLSNGSTFTTVDGSLVAFCARFGPDRRHESDALDTESMYRDHLAAVARTGVAMREVPPFDGIVAENVKDAARLWQLQLDRGFIVASADGTFRHPAAKALFETPAVLAKMLAVAGLERRRNKAAEAAGPAAARAAELQTFLDERKDRAKIVGREAAEHYTKGRGGRLLLWAVAVVTFIVVWRLLNHAPALRPPR